MYMYMYMFSKKNTHTKNYMLFIFFFVFILQNRSFHPSIHYASIERFIFVVSNEETHADGRRILVFQKDIGSG